MVKMTVLLTLLAVAAVASIAWTVRRFLGHVSESGAHLAGDARVGYRHQMRGYRAERRGDLRAAAEAYAEALALDPANGDLAARRERLLELIADSSGAAG